MNQPTRHVTSRLDFTFSLHAQKKVTKRKGTTKSPSPIARNCIDRLAVLPAQGRAFVDPYTLLNETTCR
jgi:hypothetical protein